MSLYCHQCCRHEWQYGNRWEICFPDTVIIILQPWYHEQWRHSGEHYRNTNSSIQLIVHCSSPNEQVQSCRIKCKCESVQVSARQANSQRASPLIMACKKDVTHRFCVEYHHLNLVTKADTCPLPLWTTNWINWGKLVTFSTLVLASGYKRASGFQGEDSVCEF